MNNTHGSLDQTNLFGVLTKHVGEWHPLIAKEFLKVNETRNKQTIKASEAAQKDNCCGVKAEEVKELEIASLSRFVDPVPPLVLRFHIKKYRYGFCCCCPKNELRQKSRVN